MTTVNKEEIFRKLRQYEVMANKERDDDRPYGAAACYRSWSKARWTIYENEQKWGKDDGYFKWRFLGW